MLLILSLGGIVGFMALARACRRHAGHGSASENTLNYYAGGARQSRRQAFVDWSRLNKEGD